MYGNGKEIVMQDISIMEQNELSVSFGYACKKKKKNASIQK